jgi:integrase
MRPPRDKEYRDTELSGFIVRVSKKGKVTWYIERWHAGKNGKGGNIRKKIGSMPSMGLDQARKAAVIGIGQIANGIDISKVKRERIIRQIEASNAKTFGQLYVEYFEVHRSESSRYHREQRAAFERWVAPQIGGLPASQISKADLRDLLAALEKSPQRQVFALLSKFYKHLAEHDEIQINHMATLSRPAPAEERQRVMADDEIRRYWSATERMGYPVGACYKIALLLGQRKDETRKLEWSELDLDKRTWLIPGPKTKTRQTHLVHLSDQVINVLAGCPKNSRYVFSFDDTPVTIGSHPWAELLALMSHPDMSLADLRRIAPDYDSRLKLNTVPDLRLHDTRRTMSSVLAGELGVAPHIIDKVQNHVVLSPIRRRYQITEYLKERREAVEAWGSYLARLVGAS